jgi:quinol monooxygenase YgiN
MVQAMINMEIASDKMGEALQILRSIVERTRAETGCVSCSVYQDTEAENQLVFAQEWRSEDDLQRHLRSADYQKVLLVMEMALTRPEVRFDTIITTNGVGVIERARTPQKE